MFCGLAVYGATTILFGLSRDASLSIALLLVVGAGEMLNTVIRHTIVQTNTPDAMRGRVLALQSLSVSTSGQVGMFESGVTAAWFGTVGSVVFGGVAVLAIVAVWAWSFPALRNADRPEVQPSGDGAPA
jgi:MFS family permease